MFQKSMPMKQYSRSRSTLKTVKKPAILATANHWLSISNRMLVTPSASVNACLVTISVASKFWRGSINTGCTGCTRVLQFTSLVPDFCHVHPTYPRPVARKSIRELVANSGLSLTRSRLVICPQATLLMVWCRTRLPSVKCHTVILSSSPMHQLEVSVHGLCAG